MARFDGKTALVTGASSGIGEEIAKALAGEGARTLLVGRDQERLDGIAAAIGEQGGECSVACADLVADDGPAALAHEAAGALGAIDVLVHSAGIYEPAALAETPLDVFDRTFAINVRAPFALTQALLPHLASGAAVVFIGSVSGHAGFANEVAYAASKAAIDGMTRSLASELASRGVRVNCVAPGFTISPMNAAFRESSPEMVQRVVDSTLSRRLGLVEDVAAAVLFLASDEASQIYGAVLPVDGGYPVASIQSGIAE